MVSLLKLEGSPPATLHFWPTSRAPFEFAVYKRGPSALFSSQFGFLLPSFRPPTTQNLLFYVNAPLSIWLCRHSLLFLNYPPLLPTTREDMQTAQNHLPFNHVNVATDTRKISVVNLSYPVRPIHTPWVESPAPLLIKKTESLRYQTSFVYSNGSSGLVPATNDASFGSRVLKWLKAFWLLLKCQA